MWHPKLVISLARGACRNALHLLGQIPRHWFPQWYYLQIRNFLLQAAHKWDYTRQPTPFETLCSSNTPQTPNLPCICTPVWRCRARRRYSTIPQWNWELNVHLPRKAWETLHTRSRSSSRNVNVQEHCFKLKSRWYKTILNKCFPNVPG